MTAGLAPLAWRLDARLREAPVDTAAFARAVDVRVDEIATARSQPARLLAMLIETAPLLRIAGRLEEARKTASAAAALADLLEDARSAFTAQLALAQVMQWEGRYEISTPLFDRLVSQARGAPLFSGFLHTVLFHAGTNLFDQARYPEAARFFRETLALRREAGLEELLEMTAEAIRAAARAQGRGAA